MIRRLDDDRPRRVVAGPSGPARDLVELPRLQDPLAASVVLAQRGQDDGPDRDVDADAEGVGAADDLEQTGLGELLDQAAVLRQHAGVVDADPVFHQPLQGPAEALAESEVADQLVDLLLLLLRGDVDAGQRLGSFEGGGLGEVDDVHRRLMGGEEFLERFVQRGGDVLVDQRHRALGRRHDRGRAAGPSRQVDLEALDVAEGRRHQDELGVRQFEQRHLPGPAAVGLGVEVELVHHHLTDVGGGSLAQRDVGEHLGGAADDRGAGVHRRVAGQHADLVGAEDVAQREELLRHQRLDRRGVEGALAVREGGEVRPGGDQALSRAGRRRQDHVRPRHHLDQRLLLRRVQRDPLLSHPPREGVVQGIGIGTRRNFLGQRHRQPLSLTGRSSTATGTEGQEVSRCWSLDPACSRGRTGGQGHYLLMSFGPPTTRLREETAGRCNNCNSLRSYLFNSDLAE